MIRKLIFDYLHESDYNHVTNISQPMLHEAVVELDCAGCLHAPAAVVPQDNYILVEIKEQIKAS